jgi:transcriptional regulator with XRE-family HTH domain
MLPDGTATDNLTGADLRLLRLSRRIRLSTLARAYGVSRTRLAVIEGQIEPPPTSRATVRYLAALRDVTAVR